MCYICPWLRVVAMKILGFSTIVFLSSEITYFKFNNNKIPAAFL